MEQDVKILWSTCCISTCNSYNWLHNQLHILREIALILASISIHFCLCTTYCRMNRIKIDWFLYFLIRFINAIATLTKNNEEYQDEHVTSKSTWWPKITNNACSEVTRMNPMSSTNNQVSNFVVVFKISPYIHNVKLRLRTKIFFLVYLHTFRKSR